MKHRKGEARQRSKRKREGRKDREKEARREKGYKGNEPITFVVILRKIYHTPPVLCDICDPFFNDQKDIFLSVVSEPSHFCEGVHHHMMMVHPTPSPYSPALPAPSHRQANLRQ